MRAIDCSDAPGKHCRWILRWDNAPVPCYTAAGERREEHGHPFLATLCERDPDNPLRMHSDCAASV
eukprot:8277892-Pyramimonas_sp.AAC.1